MKNNLNLALIICALGILAIQSNIGCTQQNLSTKITLEEHIVCDKTTFYSIEEANSSPACVDTLILKNKKMTIFPTEIFNYKNISYLDLSLNSIQEIPTGWENLLNLKVVNFSYNNITGVPLSLGKAANLQEIYLSHNSPLKVFPKTVCNLINLEILNLAVTDINEISDCVLSLKHLKELILFNIDGKTKISKIKQSTLKKKMPSCDFQFGN